MAREREHRALNGFVFLALGLVLAIGDVAGIITMASHEVHAPGPFLGCLGGILVGALILGGLFIVNPNEGRVLQLFGRYVGTEREAGLRWANPFYTKRKISLRVRSFESTKLKV